MKKIFEKRISQLTVIETLTSIVLAWIMIALWQQYIQTLLYNTFGLDKHSSLTTFLMAFVFTIIFLYYVYNFGTLSIDETGIGFSSPEPLDLDQAGVPEFLFQDQ